MDTARVTATRNLDFLNEGEEITVDLDERMIALLSAGHLRRVDLDDAPAEPAPTADVSPLGPRRAKNA